MRNGSVYVRPTSVLRMDGSGCSSSPGLPTPRATDWKGPDPLSRQRDGKVRPPSGDDLPTAVVRSLLPTPSVADGMGGHLTRSGSRSEELLLPGVAKSLAEGPLLPTPTVSDTNGAGAHGTGGPDLRTAVSLLPTPRATDGTKGGPNQRGSSGDLMLPSAVMLLPIPTAMDSKASGGSTPADVTLTDAVVRTGVGRTTNPRHEAS
jgi:DNA (cytosine-5)-methyltransferase 1